MERPKYESAKARRTNIPRWADIVDQSNQKVGQKGALALIKRPSHSELRFKRVFSFVTNFCDRGSFFPRKLVESFSHNVSPLFQSQSLESSMKKEEQIFTALCLCKFEGSRGGVWWGCLAWNGFGGRRLGSSYCEISMALMCAVVSQFPITMDHLQNIGATVILQLIFHCRA